MFADNIILITQYDTSGEYKQYQLNLWCRV